jgi:transcriptional regulator with XRE-family HTH domain
VDDVRVGRVARALRRRRGWRQIDLAARVGCHQTTISRLERGHWRALSFERVRRIFGEMDAGLEALVRWRAGEVDRLLDERHAVIIEAVARRTSGGWQVHPEVTYNEYGERGSIDLLNLREVEKAACIFEVKGDVSSVEATIRKHGEKARLASGIIKRRWGWRPRAIARILVIEDTMTARRAVARHSATFRAAYPATSREVTAWLRQPDGSLAGIWFLSVKHPRADSGAGGGSRRVRARRRVGS